jgi:formylglycine-generating enzyme required for sulfatase activity
MAQVSEPAPGERMTDTLGITMVYVPAGKFLMGSDEKQVDEIVEQVKKEYADTEKDWYTDQMPQHEQIIQRGFWLDLTPVTNESYARFVADGGYRTQELWTLGGWKWVQDNRKTSPIEFPASTEPQQPKIGVSWFEACAYARWRDCQLPTEAQWEWAARGPQNRIYPWGDSFVSENIIWRENGGGKTAPVGDGIRRQGASWIKALDMTGNVLEWCSSLYRPYPYETEDGRENIDDSTNLRALRGGSWVFYFTTYLRAAFRSWGYPGIGCEGIGFRCTRLFD